MDLYLMRHGDAVDRVTGGYELDEERPLTGAGRSEIRHAARALAKLGGERQLDLVVTSPLVRARQTAAIVAEALEPRRGPGVSDALAPGGRPAAVLDAILAYRDGAGTPRRVIAVGHMPGLGQLAGWLVWGDERLAVPLRTAGICRITLPEPPTAGDGDLRWLLTPRLLRRLS